MNEKTNDNYMKEPMSDVTFRKLILSSVISIILCVFFLCGTTFAWLSDTKESGKNTIRAGFFDAEIVECHSQTDEELKYHPDIDDSHCVESFFDPGSGATTAVVVVERVENALKGYVVAEYYEGLDPDGTPKSTQIKEIVDDGEITFAFAVESASTQRVKIKPYFGVMPNS